MSPLFGSVMLAANWLDSTDTFITHASTTAKAAVALVAIVVIGAAFGRSKSLGAVLSIGLVAGLALFMVNNTKTLETNTKDTFITNAAPAGMITPHVGGGIGGGGGGAFGGFGR